MWNYRRMLRSPLIHPFREVLRPLVRWVFASHWFIYDERNPQEPISLNPEPWSLMTLALAILLAPLLFLLLLPLVLILVPLAFVFGAMCAAASAFQADGDDMEHHSLLWHSVH